MVFCITAISQNGVIGVGGKIPWHSAEELKHFKNITTGFPIIMGRKTFQSLNEPLKNRLNIIISKNNKTISSKNNILQFASLYKAYNYLKKNCFDKVFICGGSRIYKNAIKHVDEMIVSVMNFEVDGDKYFPRINKNIWSITNQIQRKEFTVFYYTRRKKS